MSFLSSINVGINSRRDVHNLSGHTHSTTELGYFQPTFCRYIVPDSKLKINARSICRLSPVAVPTIGQVSLRNYFYYVDIATLWTPFDAMRKVTNYRYGDGSVSQPLAIPTFRLCDFFKDAFKPDQSLSRSTFIRDFRESVVCTVYDSGTAINTANGLASALLSCFTYNSSQFLFVPFTYKQTSNQAYTLKSQSTSAIVFDSRLDLLDKLPIVKNSNADFSFTISDGQKTYHILGKFTGLSKRVRKQFIGCGYSFNPFDTTRQTLLKLFAVYKAWFDTMAVQRTINFNNTECYSVIKYLSENPPLTHGYDSNTGKYFCNVYDSTYYSSSIDDVITTFICKLGDICYNLPPDYFSASDTSALRGAQSPVTTPDLTSILSTNSGTVATSARAHASVQGVIGDDNFTTSGGSFNGSALELAKVLLRWTNKRSVIGRKISELLAIDGEKDVHNNEHENVHHLGVDRLNIDISPIFSQSSTTDASLGDYAAIGYGQGGSDTYVYDTNVYGILLCLSAVVPTSGYFQGILHENGDSNPYDFFVRDYDALGYQGIYMNELISDLQFKTAANANTIGCDLGFMGVAPRYQHLKVGRNICNGDMSIPSMQPVMLPYTLDRHFITCVPKGNADDFEDVSVPAVDPSTFRQIKANDAYGDYNRIFQYVGSDYDHFILHFNFDCKVVSPMKSVANSYDTFQDDDRDALKFEHE